MSPREATPQGVGTRAYQWFTREESALRASRLRVASVNDLRGPGWDRGSTYGDPVKEGSCRPALGGVQVKGAVVDELVIVSKDLLLSGGTVPSQSASK